MIIIRYDDDEAHVVSDNERNRIVNDPLNYPMPAIPLAVKYDYLGCVNIDDVSNPDDPIILYMWDSWTQQNV